MYFSKEMAFGKLVELYRESVRKKLRYQKSAFFKGKGPKASYFYEGAWRSGDEIAALNEALRRKDRGAVVELIVLLVLFGGIDLLVALILLAL